WSNLLDYIAWRGDLSFAASPFNDVDNLLLSMLSFVDLSEIVPGDVLGGPVKLGECSRVFFERHPDGCQFGVLIPAITNELFRQAAACRRYKEVYVSCFLDELDEAAGKQFAAVTFLLPDNSIFIAFRGTDDTLVGWHEDFQLSFLCPTPSQQAAASYVDEIGGLYRGDIRLGGHSKGGNLAIYGAVRAKDSVKRRILRAYSNDGPGFTEEMIRSPEYAVMEEKLLTLLPQSSIVGMLLEQSGPYEVVRSTHMRLLQHDPFSWQILGPAFVRMPALSKEAVDGGDRIRRWLAKMSPEDRRVFTEVFFHVLEASDAKTLTDLTEGNMKTIGAMIRTVHELPQEAKQQMMGFLKLLAQSENKK
ncbi:MAG: DUF2974 domain-containing protein, partial [Clostridia bacterium]|nr:DUF2974 domain-containing protein [Clostridia bacterium]